MRVLITGSRGFIGQNMVARLGVEPDTDIVRFDRGDSIETLALKLSQADAVIHLAGENRPSNLDDFLQGNVELTEAICRAIESSGRRVPLILASSRHVLVDKLRDASDLVCRYAESKLLAEQAVQRMATRTGNPVAIYRLPGVFGKWCKPNYNSVVATFCHNIANDLPIQINNPDTQLQLVYIDDVVSEFMRALQNISYGVVWGEVTPEANITLGDLAKQIEAFRNCRNNLYIERVGVGLTRALYSTYISYLHPNRFIYDLPLHADLRGVFVEMLKTQDCGQFSYFTAHAGVTRGGHYHHSKTEKFLVIRGRARFRFRHVNTDKCVELYVSGEKPQVVDSVPGWIHDITNIGDDEMIVMLWANENFDRDHPDTIPGMI
jgi:UDP-2-acetamido-2,6-beta-L-arabino-hexul-4-ose reductase